MWNSILYTQTVNCLGSCFQVSDLAAITAVKQSLADLVFHVEYAVEPRQSETGYAVTNGTAKDT